MKIGDLVKFIYEPELDVGIILEIKEFFINSKGCPIALVLFSNPERVKWLDIRDLNGVRDD